MHTQAEWHSSIPRGAQVYIVHSSGRPLLEGELVGQHDEHGLTVGTTTAVEDSPFPPARNVGSALAGSEWCVWCSGSIRSS